MQWQINFYSNRTRKKNLEMQNILLVKCKAEMPAELNRYKPDMLFDLLFQLFSIRQTLDTKQLDILCTMF